MGTDFIALADRWIIGNSWLLPLLAGILGRYQVVSAGVKMYKISQFENGAAHVPIGASNMLAGEDQFLEN